MDTISQCKLPHLGFLGLPSLPQGKIILVLFLSLILPGLTGCLGPRGLSATRNQYNQAIVRTNAEETLLNIVRLRYLEQGMYLPVSGVTSQFEFNTAADILTGQDRGDASNLFGAQVGFVERPTVVYNPTATDKLSQLQFSPIRAEELNLLLDNYLAGRVLRLFTSQINGLDNASTGHGPTPPITPQYADFVLAARLLSHLQTQQALLFRREQRHVDLEEIVPITRPSTKDIIALKKAGYGVRKVAANKEEYRLTTAKVVQKVQFRIEPDTVDTVNRLVRLLGLDPTQKEYDLTFGQADFPVRDSTVDPHVPPKSPVALLAPRPVHEHFPVERRLQDKIAVTPRSLIQTLFFLSQGVEVPDEHIEAGLVRLTFNPDGSIFDWGLVLNDLFRVQSCKHQPKNAFAAIHYRGYWFYIEESDTLSIGTILVYNSALRLQALLGVTKDSGAPVLTLPVGG
jgi:hypothetical protein